MITILRKGIARYRLEGLRGLRSSVEDRLSRRLGMPVRTLGDLRNAIAAQLAGPPFARALRALEHRPTVSVVQVGAFVGPTENDPLYDFVCRVCCAKHGSLAVLIEPVAEHFDRLRQNYGDHPNLRFENVAIAEAAGEREFYRLGVDPTAYGFPAYLAQLGSLDPNRMGSLWDRYERRVDYKEFFLAHRVVDRVRCVTLADILSKHGIHELDLLQIDAEGYDYQILRTLDFGRIRPRYVNYERVLLHDSEAACRRLMRGAGYRLIDHGQDTLCVRR